MISPMNKCNKVILIGFMASGKSSVAEHLAPQLGWDIRHLDDDIVSRSGLPSVAAIFKEHGEPYFRELEAEAARSLRDADKVVIAAGGGVISRAANMENLSANDGVVVYLKTSFETIADRIGEVSTRPLFADKASALDLYMKRLPVYESYADITVDTDDRTTEEVSEEILNQLRPSVCD